MKKSQELISTDIHTSSKSYKFTFSVELVPICKDDLVALPLKLAHSVGNIAPLAICHRIGTSINLLDPNTLQTADVATSIYWRSPFKSLADVQELVEFVVMDTEPIGPSKGRFLLAEATVARASDLGINSTTYFTRTHLGGVLHPGDSVMGYHLSGTNFNNPHFEALEKSSSYASKLPDVILVKKSYPRRKKKSNGGKARNWRLKRMAREEGDVLPKKQDQERIERDYEMFLRDVEEDSELRSTLALYKAANNDRTRKTDKMQGVVQEAEMEDETRENEVGEDNDDDDDEDEDLPKIDMTELLDEFDDLHVGN